MITISTTISSISIKYSNKQNFDIIEVCLYYVSDKKNMKGILRDYYFNTLIDASNKIVFHLAYCRIYNHYYKTNIYTIDIGNRKLLVISKNIRKHLKIILIIVKLFRKNIYKTKIINIYEYILI